MKHNHIDDLELSLYASGYKNLRESVRNEIQGHLTDCELCRRRFKEQLHKVIERYETEERAKAEADVRVKAEEKARAEAEEKTQSYAAALTQAEEKLAKAKEEAEERLKTGTEERLRVEAEAAEAIKIFKRISLHVFHPRAMKRKFAFFSVLAILSTIALVVILTSVVNNQPVANDDSVTTQEDRPVSISLTGSDPDGDSLSYSVVTGPSHGRLSGTAPKLRYSPKVNFNGSDSFTFKVSDKRTDSEAATVSITVKAVNDAPTANDERVTTQEDRPVSIRLSGNDPDGDSLNYSVVKGPSHGSLRGTAPKLRYSPMANFNGSDSFTFKVSDETADSDAATVSITVTAANDPPSANDDSARTQEDTPIEAIDVLRNDTDVDDDPLRTSAVTQGKNGSVAINADNTLSYSPKANFCGTDSFTYTVSDGKGGTDTATVNVKVEAVNDAPTFTSTPVTTATVGALYTYDVNAMDPDVGDTLAYSLTVRPTGMTIDAATGLIQWILTSAQAGANDVVVKVADNGSVPASNTQSFTITVKAISSPQRVCEKL